jgi:hypothetical protein
MMQACSVERFSDLVNSRIDQPLLVFTRNAASGLPR